MPNLADVVCCCCYDVPSQPELCLVQLICILLQCAQMSKPADFTQTIEVLLAVLMVLVWHTSSHLQLAVSTAQHSTTYSA